MSLDAPIGAAVMSNQLNSDEARKFLRASGLVSYEDFLVDLPAKTSASSATYSSPFSDEKRRELVRIRNLAASTAAEDGPVYLGVGDYDHHSPSAIDRLASQLEFQRASSETREDLSRELYDAIFRFEQTARRLSGMASANVSLFRGCSALGRACHIAAEATGRPLVLAPDVASPEALERLNAYANLGAFELRIIPSIAGLTDLGVLRKTLALDGARTAAVVAPYPNFFGCLDRMGQIAEATRAAGALFVTAVDPVALAILRPPAEWGADFVVGDVHTVPARRELGDVQLGFIATSRRFLESAPTTLVRRVETESGGCGYCLARDFGRGAPATETTHARALDSLRTLVCLAYADARELRRVAKTSHERARLAHDVLARAGFEFLYDAPYLREFAVKIADPDGMFSYLEKWGIVGGYKLDDGMILAFTEKRSVEEIDELVYFMTEYRDRVSRDAR